MRFWPCLPAYCVAALVAVRPDVIRGATVNFYPTCSSADNFGLTWPTVAGGASSPTYSVAGWGSAHPITLTISDTGTWAATAWYMNNVNGIWSQWFDASGTRSEEHTSELQSPKDLV